MADPFYSSAEWRALRLQALRLARWRCRWCRASVQGKGAARVDHITTRREAPELALDLLNLRVLCPACDNRRHAEKGGKPVQLFNAEGEPLDPLHHWNRKR